MQSPLPIGSASDDRIPGPWKPIVGRWSKEVETDAAERVAMLSHSGDLFELNNVHSEPGAAWTVSPSDWLRVLRDAAGLFHSHPSGRPTPSAADISGQIGTAIPWVICPRGGEPFALGPRSPAPVVGRGYRFGVDDCFSCFRDAFEEFSGDVLPNFARSWGFWKHGKPLFENGVAAAGFVRVGQDINGAEKGDALLFRIHSRGFNHAAFYEGGGMMTHHPAPAVPFDPARLSVSERVDRWVSRLDYEVFRRGPR